MITICEMDNDVVVQCDDCGSTWLGGEVSVDTCELYPGEETPAGRCPDCGALCFVVPKPVAAQPLSAAEVLARVMAWYASDTSTDGDMPVELHDAAHALVGERIGAALISAAPSPASVAADLDSDVSLTPRDGLTRYDGTITAEVTYRFPIWATDSEAAEEAMYDMGGGDARAAVVAAGAAGYLASLDYDGWDCVAVDSDASPVCHHCGVSYDDAGDGYDGLCPTCADRADGEAE